MAALFEALLGAKNPLTQWASANGNTLTGLGASLLNDGMNFTPLQQGRALDQDIARQKEEDAKRLAQNEVFKGWLANTRPDLVPLLDAGVSSGDLFNQALKPQGAGKQPIEINGQLVDPETFQVLGDFRTVEGKGGNAEVALQPTWMQDAQGNWVLGQLAKDGTIIQTKLPPGMTAANPGAIAGDRTTGTVDAKTAGAARAALPGAQVQRDTTLKSIDRILGNTAGLDEWFGQVGPRGIYVNPGSAMGNFVADFSQAEGQSFLQARQFLKGQGAITELESAKAEQAYSRMAAAKKSGDKQNFLDAAADFRAAVEEGYRKLEATAAGGYAQGAPNAPAPVGANRTSTGISYTVEP